jgi:hypothetical protein
VPEARRALWRWVALPLAVGLILLVAFASRSTATSGDLSGVNFESAVRAGEIVGYVAIFLGIVLLPVALIVGQPWRRVRGGDTTKPTRELPPVPLWIRVLAFFFVVAVIVAQVYVLFTYLALLLDQAQRFGGAGGGVLGALAGAAGIGPGSPVETLVIALVIALLMIGSLVALVIKWRLQDDRSDTTAQAYAATALAVEVSLDALRREADPRRAIIAAYAAMERSLSRAGLGRHHSEAPLEYLRRVLASPTSAAGEVRTITDLFQLAAFSLHSVDESMRARAIDALELLRAATASAA